MIIKAYQLKTYTLWYAQKKFYTRTRIRVKVVHNWLKFQPFSLIGGDHRIKKRGNYLTA